MKSGEKYVVIKGGKFRNSEQRMKVGEIWDLVYSEAFECHELRKLNQRGGCIMLLNGIPCVRSGLASGHLALLDTNDPRHIEHDALRYRVRAR